MSMQKKSLIGTTKKASKAAERADSKGAKNVSARSVQSARAVHAKRAASFRLAANHNQVLH